MRTMKLVLYPPIDLPCTTVPVTRNCLGKPKLFNPHGKSLLSPTNRLHELHENSMRNRRLGGVATSNLAFLRERVERQRSVVVPSKMRTGSLENLDCDLRNDVENTRNSVERLDTQISTLHQDVATLSMEVCTKYLFVRQS